MIGHLRHRRPARRAIIGALLLTLLIGAGFLFLDRPRSTARPLATTWVPVQPALLENQLGLIGRIEADTRITLAAPFDGRIEQIAVSENQRVDKGQLLATLDTTQLDIRIREARAELLKASRTLRDMHNWLQSNEVIRARRAVSTVEDNLQDIQTKLAETRRLYERGIVARMEVDALEQQLKSQRRELATSRDELRTTQRQGQGDNLRIAEMEEANARTHYDTLLALRSQRERRAPFDGIVLHPSANAGKGGQPPVQAGQFVSQGTPLFELASTTRLHACARVEESDLDQLSVDMPVQITSNGFKGMTLQGHIQSLGVQALDSDSYGGGSTYEVTVAIDPLPPEQHEHLRLGMSARLAITTYHQENGLAVPVEALHKDDQGRDSIIYRPALDTNPRQVPVTVGRAVPQGVEVFGLKPGYVELPP